MLDIIPSNQFKRDLKLAKKRGLKIENLRTVVNIQDVLMEEASTITQENLENAKIIMDENAYEKAIIVSDLLHMKRAMLLAEVLSLHHRIIP